MKSRQSESRDMIKTPESGEEEGSLSQEQILLSTMNRAALLARWGKHLQAEELLRPLIENDNSRVEIVDLMARIYAQQGKFEQAQYLWIKLLEKDPSNLHVLSALRTCAIYRKPGFESFIFQHSWLLISVLLWFLLVIGVIIG